MVRRAISQPSHEKIGDCEQSRLFLIISSRKMLKCLCHLMCRIVTEILINKTDHSHRSERKMTGGINLQSTQRSIIISKGYDSNKQQRVKRNMHINL